MRIRISEFLVACALVARIIIVGHCGCKIFTMQYVSCIVNIFCYRWLSEESLRNFLYNCKLVVSPILAALNNYMYVAAQTNFE